MVFKLYYQDEKQTLQYHKRLLSSYYKICFIIAENYPRILKYSFQMTPVLRKPDPSLKDAPSASHTLHSVQASHQKKKKINFQK